MRSGFFRRRCPAGRVHFRHARCPGPTRPVRGLPGFPRSRRPVRLRRRAGGAQESARHAFFTTDLATIAAAVHCLSLLHSVHRSCGERSVCDNNESALSVAAASDEVSAVLRYLLQCSVVRSRRTALLPVAAASSTLSAATACALSVAAAASEQRSVRRYCCASSVATAALHPSLLLRSVRRSCDR